VTLQLNPDTTDDYESKTFAEMRQMVFDGLGFIDPLSNDNRTLLMIRTSIVNRLGLAVALLVGGDTFATVLTNTYNACGFAALGTHPPGVDTLLTDFINQAQQMLFRRIELDKGSATLPVAGTISIDSALVQSAAIALAKAHFGQPDAQSYGQQAERYLADLTQRTPPNIVGQINAAVIDAHNTILRRYELGRSALGAPSFGTAILGNYTSTAADGNTTIADDQPVELLALANLKTKIGQPDAKAMFEQYEQYMSDVTRRQPPNATSIVNNQLKITQQTLYRKYDLFRMERWWTWSLVAGQRFYGTFGADDARSIAPTGLTALEGTPGGVVSHNTSVPHARPAYVLLNDGRALIAGGYTSRSTIATNIAEIFDPATGVFTLTAPMNVARTWSAFCLLQNGTVLVTGGGPFGYDVVASAEIYDPAQDTWTLLANSMTTPRAEHSCVLLGNGSVLISGGVGADLTTAIGTSELYNPQLGTFTAGPAMVTARKAFGMTLLANGKVLLNGGLNAASAVTDHAELYDPVANTFTATGAMVVGRASMTPVLMPDGRVLVAGGVSTLNGAELTAEVYQPSTGTWAATGSMTDKRFFYTAILMPNENVLVASGGDGTVTPQVTAEIFDPVTNTFSLSAGTMPTGAMEGAVYSLHDGRILIANGHPGVNNFAINTAMFYDPDTDAFSATGSLTAGSTFYVVTAATANGESLPSNEAFVLTVPVDTAIDLSWTPTPKQPFVKWFNIYRGKTSGAEGYIDRVPASQTTYTDDGTIPQGRAVPTENNTQGPGSIDPRHVTWVGLSFNDNVWNPLIKGIPPMAFGQNINGVPTNYEIRQALEIWPAPTTTDWKVQIKGYFEPQVFETDDDTTTLDWQAIYLWTLADAMPRFRNQRGQPWFNQLEISQAQANAMQYIKHLVAGTHMTARYVPGVILERNAVRPVLVGPYVGYP
jgi:hypothetical protein